ncbi:sigma-70 family RNA polymerase sigma factor [Lysinibacillus fusiformis]|uniref:RNA polymerase sigma factor n=1 Tax=Lysinibacillus fusiformis TaxID=28031 RepID=UPI001E4A15DF|nr:sigma-70 family RNA polymerase sigma factor [Lysinibacillus fusiformis]MCE4042870.1 sigma-70 family RNA polymerase sigma factor [Lysinibacillus fusiformis]
MKKFAGLCVQEIVQTYSDTLIRIAVHQTKNMSEAEDIVQEVYMTLMKQRKSFDHEDHLKAWLIKVTFNKCKDYFKSARMKKTVPITEEMSFIAKEEQMVLTEIFELNPKERVIVYLHYYEGYTTAEIANLLGMNVNTIGSKLRRARMKLKIILEEGSTV